MSLRGVDIRESGAILFRTLLQDSNGDIVPSGSTQIRLYEFQNDGRLFQYDFADSQLVFTSGVLTTPSGLMTQRKAESAEDDPTGGIDTGIWTYLLPHASGFTEGNIYLQRSTNSSASPTDQYREFQFGNGVLADLQLINGDPTNPIVQIASGTWSRQTSEYSESGTFGEQLQPIYYADIDYYHDEANTRDEYGVKWFKNSNILTSGELSDPAMTVIDVLTGTEVLSNQVLSFTNNKDALVYHIESTTILQSGEPYCIQVSGLIGSATRSWPKIVGTHVF